MSRSSWMVLWAAFSAGVIATLVQFSIPPILSLIKDQYGLSYTDSALLMSLFALATLLSAVPGGFIVQRHGVRKIGLLGIGIMFIGVLTCLLANSYGVILFGRIIEGIGFGLVSVAAPSAIGQYVAPRMMSIAMGIWSTWIPVGSLLMFLFAPKLVLNYKSDVYWIFLMIVIALCFLFYAMVIPKQVLVKSRKGADTLETNTPKLKKEVLLSEIKNKNVWWAALAFASFTFAFFSFNTWISTYLTETTSMSLAAASLVPSLVALLTMTSNLFSGILLNKLGNHLYVFLIPPLIFVLAWPFFTNSSLAVLYGVAAIMGLFSGFMPTIIFASAPLLAKRKETIGIVMSIIIIGENTGILIGPEVFGLLREWTGQYTASYWILSIASLLMLVSSLKIWKSGVFKPKNSSNINIQDNAASMD
ncbi:MFS transporter [Niallia oryzisoli]|uniref:MFS transporter n=1 Tax=Niallia oryzisoli TaxID=1737571 RepID=A0ABZ2CIM9_9BACI